MRFPCVASAASRRTSARATASKYGDTSQPRRLPYIEVTPGDVEIANRLAHEVLGRTLDELAPQSRRLLLLLDAMVREACQQQEHKPIG